MFFCDDCAKKNDWPILHVSRGPCEVCKTNALCTDLKASDVLGQTDPLPQHVVGDSEPVAPWTTYDIEDGKVIPRHDGTGAYANIGDARNAIGDA